VRGGGLSVTPSLSTPADAPLAKKIGVGTGAKHEVNAGLLTRNWVINLLGWVAPLTVALVAIPYVVKGLGPERFGVLSLASALLGYFGIFDLGLGRATTKSVAECLARGDLGRLPKVVWTSLWSQAFFGAVGTLATIGLIPVLVDRYLKISPGLAGETRTCLMILSGSLCIVLTGNALRGVLEAAQRFDVVNYVKVPTNTSMFLLPALGVHWHLSLSGIVGLLVTARVGATLAYLAACLRFFPALRGHYLPHRASLRPLLVYGGWVTVSNLITPLLSYVDRFFIGSLVSMSAVGYYSAPYEAINRAWVVPATLAATLFPAFAHLDASGSHGRMEELCARSLKSLLLLSAPALLLLAVFAKPILRWWLGADFAGQSAVVLQILALAMLINSAALIPFSLLQGVGRPDLTGIFSLIEVVFQAVLCWWLVRGFGIAGAALAALLRAALDAVLMFGAVFWIHSVSFRSLLGRGIRRTLVAVTGLGAGLALLWILQGPLLLQIPLAATLVLVFGLACWTHVLDGTDRDLLAGTAAHFRLALGRTK
jgi:O-antigen/teichoic acid export membrane protein